MKWKCTFQPEDQEAVNIDLTVLRLRYPKGKLHVGFSGPDQIQMYLKANPADSQELAPCDFCEYNPPSARDGKPCGVCPAVKRLAFGKEL